MRKKFLLLVLLGQSSVLFSQIEQAKLEKIVPASPTAAALAKYGDIPVNYYSGAPSVNIPLFNISSGKLDLPVSLSYQFNGLKTEEIASWVGLGWSLNAGGVISRSVRGMPDEIGGYMSPVNMTVQYMIDHPNDPAVKQHLREAGKGTFDTEPDIFFYNFPGHSGKFYYRQEDQKFYTMPQEDLTVIYTGNGGFLIVTPEGKKYTFEQQEVTTTWQRCDGNLTLPSSMTTSSWYLSSVKNSSESEIITFTYTDGVYTFDHLSTHTKYFLTTQWGSTTGPTPPDYIFNWCNQTSVMGVKRLSQINFRNGALKFFTSGTERCDLPGDKSLQAAGLYDAANNLIKQYTFNYGYFGAACPGGQTSRLKLLSIQESGPLGNILMNPYEFEYEENGSFPGRLSFAQDYWGYNNGAISNQTLIPPTTYINQSGTAIYMPGANRLPNFDGAKLGSIKKIVYPTRGTTEFVFENNEVNDVLITPTFEWYQSVLEGDHNGGQQTYYEKTFVINEPPNPFNFNNPNGGAYVDIEIDALGCDFSGGATTCAVLFIDGVNPDIPSLFGPIISNIPGHYLPNGTYKMRASFNQVPPMFEDFYFGIKWKHAVYNHTYLVGGIRLKQMTDYDGVDHANDKKKFFSYASDADGFSSGKVYSYPFDYETTFNHEFWNGYDNGITCVESILYRAFIKRNSNSSYPLVSATGGSYVGYGQVTVSYGSNAANGKTVFKFRQVPDIIYNYFPKASTSREWMRGLLTEEKDLQSNGDLKSKTETNYPLPAYTTITGVAKGLKPGFLTTASRESCGPELPYLIRQELLTIPYTTQYETFTGKSQLDSKVSTSYELTSSIQQTEEYAYNASNYLPSSVKVSNSKGEVVTTKFKYNIDYTIANNNPAWLYHLQQKKVSSFPVEKLTIVKNPDNSEYVIGGTLTVYKNDKPLIDKIYVFETSSPVPLSAFTQSYVDAYGGFVKDSRYKEAITINQYDQYYNVLAQQKTNDVVTSIIWGYNQQYPVAQVVGKSYDDAVSQSGINLSVINNPATDDNTMRTELNKLRNLSGAFVITFTYKKQVGVTSETDPRGRTTYYEYDDLGRLSLVRDHENKIIKKICYNYYGITEDCSPVTVITYYNVAMSQVFTRNNCPSGYIGSQVTYSVAANTYSSTISQAAANQLAQNDMNNNGQAYANVNGVCAPGGCNTSNCTGNDKKCINNICETGMRINISSVKIRGGWLCTYKYRWSDSSESPNYTEINSIPCGLSVE